MLVAERRCATTGWYAAVEPLNSAAFGRGQHVAMHGREPLD